MKYRSIQWLYILLACILVTTSVFGAACSSSSKDAVTSEECTEGQMVTVGSDNSGVIITETESTYVPDVGTTDECYSVTESAPSIAYDPVKPEVNVEIPPTKITVEPCSPGPVSTETIGLATGGAKDVGNFRQNIENGYLPLPTDITYEGLFYDYYFDTGEKEPAEKLFSPSYSFAVTRDPFSDETEYYLSVGLNSGLQEKDFQRKKLNLIVVLDISGSMKSPFDSYYYDRYGGFHEVPDVDFREEKIELATESITALLDHLNEDDLFGMVVFNKEATVIRDLSPIQDMQMSRLKKQILNISAYGSTHLSAGMNKATELFDELAGVNQDEYENRIIFLTDAMPNTGDTSASGLLGMAQSNADNHIHTTFIGIGVDFNTELVQLISNMRGSNYYTIHSSDQFRERMDEEFEYMVTPLVFDLQLNLQAAGWEIEKVYGSPEADEATGNLMKVNTLFPSKKSGGQTRGGLILLKLKETGAGGNIQLSAIYEDRNGNRDSSSKIFSINGESPEYFENTGIRKGIVLARYANLMKDWLIDERYHYDKGYSWEPRIDDENGIIIPDDLNQWERQSLPLTVSRGYEKIFGYFYRYFENEVNAINDVTLEQELAILQSIIDN